jgi:hypothetical protein
MSIGWVQSQDFQCFCASVQQEAHPPHIIDVHVTELDSAEQVNHDLQKAHFSETHHRQSSCRGGVKGGMGVVLSAGSS